METNLDNLTTLVTEHRREKKRGKYPAEVWALIAELRKRHSVEEISRSTGIAASCIFRKTSEKRREVFREVKLVSPPLTKAVSVEVRRNDGAELRVCIEASRQEVSTLFAEFLR